MPSDHVMRQVEEFETLQLLIDAFEAVKATPNNQHVSPEFLAAYDQAITDFVSAAVNNRPKLLEGLNHES